MAPKKVPTPTLTRAEQLLLLVAARIDTGIRYMEANPGAGRERLLGHLDEEMVSLTKINNNELLKSRILQKNVRTIYGQFPQSTDVRHRIHASIAVVGKEWQRAAKEKAEQDLSKISAEVLNARCDTIATAFPSWPKVLSAKDLSKQAAEQPEENHWWLAEQAADDGGEGR